MKVNSTFANVTQSQTDTVLVAAVVGRRVRVYAFFLAPVGTPSTVAFNSKPAGAGSAISATFTPGSSGGLAPGFNPDGWFDTNVGEGLSVSTGAGSTTSIQLTYALLM